MLGNRAVNCKLSVQDSLSKRMRFMRFFLILYIVFNHTCAAALWPPELMAMIRGEGVVSLFFFISGYFLTWRLQENESISFGVLLEKKFFTLLLPYLLWNLLIFLPKYFLPLLGGKVPFMPDTGTELAPFWSSFAAAQGITAAAPVDVPLWFVRNLFCFFVISPVLLRLARIRGMICFALALTVADIACPMSWQGCGMFLTGMIFGLKKQEFRFLDRAYWLTLLAAACLIGTFFPGFRMPLSMIFLLAGAVQILLMIQLGAWLERHMSSSWEQRFVLLSDSSFFLFCIHSPIVSTLGRISAKYADSMAARGLAVLLIMTVSVCLSLFAAGILKRFLPVAFDVLNGKRISRPY